jgi:hypothetical protein
MSGTCHGGLVLTDLMILNGCFVSGSMRVHVTCFGRLDLTDEIGIIRIEEIVGPLCLG